VSLVLNFSPIRFDDAEITVGRLPYGDDGEHVLERFREERSATHFFRREGPDSIFAVPVAPDASLIGEPETIRLKEHLSLATALIRNALLAYFARLGRTVLSYEPLEVISREDLLRGSCPKGFAPPMWLGERVLYALTIRPIYFFGQKPFVAAVLDMRTTRLIERTAAELIADGICLNGVYVGKRVLGKDPRIAPDIKSLGCVQSEEGSQLRLTDSIDGIETVQASEVWPSRDLFATCLSHVFKERAAEITAALERKRATRRQGPVRLSRIRRILRVLGKQREMAAGITFTFGPLIDSSMRSFPRLQTAPRPVYVFDETGSKTRTWHDEGLNKYGPHTPPILNSSQPRMCVICQRSHERQVGQFLRKFFFQGVKLSSVGIRSKSYFEKGFCCKYVLPKIDYQFFLAEFRSADSYKKACQQALEKHGSGEKWDLALVQTEEAFHQLPPERNPYFIAKMSFHTHQIPVQEFEIETTQKWGSQLSFCLNNMGLATFAKLNGIPWLLRANSPKTHELIIGLGSAEVGEGRLGQRERFVGITTVFTGDGNYHLSNLSKAVAKDEYWSALLESVRGGITHVQTAMNWQCEDRVRLVFHATFKPFSREEVRSINNLVSDFGDYHIEYAFVTVSNKHPYLLFDTSQCGERDFDSGRIKGQYAPARGWYLQLGKRDVLLSLTGPREVKTPQQGTPHPVLLSLHPDSSFTDMPYLARQIFSFSWHSWRTFLPVSLPVTIQYSNLIADKLGHLSRLERWDPDVMLGRIVRTRWFL